MKEKEEGVYVYMSVDGKKPKRTDGASSKFRGRFSWGRAEPSQIITCREFKQSLFPHRYLSDQVVGIRGGVLVETDAVRLD